MHTYVLLELSPTAFAEIQTKMKAAGYQHAFGSDGEIDMHGIAVIEKQKTLADEVQELLSSDSYEFDDGC